MATEIDLRTDAMFAQRKVGIIRSEGAFGRLLRPDEIISVAGKEKGDEMKRQLFTVVVLRHKVTDERYGTIETDVVVKPFELLAANAEAAGVVGLARLGKAAEVDPEELEVSARPF